MQNLHDFLITDHLTHNVIPDPNSGGFMLNGRSTRILGLAAISPILLLAKDVHRAKIAATSVTLTSGEPTSLVLEPEGDPDAEVDEGVEEHEEEDDMYDSDNPNLLGTQKRRPKMVESQHMKDYRNFFKDKHVHKFLKKLCDDIYANAEAMDQPQHENIFGLKVDLNTGNTKQLAAAIIHSSVRLNAR